MFGWRGRLLRVDLSKKSVGRELLDLKTARSHLGGRGLGAYFLSDGIHGGKAAGNPLVFAAGPLTGTIAPNGGRYAIVTRSLSSGAMIASSISGKFGPELKFAGFDAVIVTDAADKPVYLWIHDGEAEVRSAQHLAGKTIAETADILRKETDADAVIAGIGPAGENEVTGAVVSDGTYSAAGANGIGLVMGAKKLKAVVVRGTMGLRVADRDQLLKTSMDLRSFMKDKPIHAKGSACGAVLRADSLAWDSLPPGVKAARTRGCFSCATSFSSFNNEGKELPLLGGDPPADLNERLKEYRCAVNYGMDYTAACAWLRSWGEEAGNLDAAMQKLIRESEGSAGPAGNSRMVDRGPCFAAGYAVVPDLAGAAADSDVCALLAVLDSVGLCPFLAAGINMETVAALVSAATGVAFAPEELVQAGQRIGSFFR